MSNTANRQGEVVYPYKMPRLKPEDGRDESKQSRQEDPATSGSLNESSELSAKYTETPAVFSKFLVDKIFKSADLGLIEASYAKASWAKHCTAFNCIAKFELAKKLKCNWPIRLEELCEFTSWALKEKVLKPSTVKSYLSSIKIIHGLANVEYLGNHPVISSMLRGAENLAMYNNKGYTGRKVITLALLKLIGHQIAVSNWCADSKITVWGACVVAFFGSFRFGELLPKKSYAHCNDETLLWNDIKFRKDGSVLIHIKIDKSRNMNGSYVDIFEFPNKNCCAVRTLRKMRDLKYKLGSPVFQFNNGKNICSAQLNSILYKLLKPIIGETASQITGHSFRAGLPSALANNPNMANDNDIKSWGRWSSDSYLLYTKLKLKQKRALFEKIISVLKE